MKKFLTSIILILTVLFIVGCEEDVSTTEQSEQATEIEEQEEKQNENEEIKEKSEEKNESNDKVVTKQIESDLKVHYIDVGQADATLLQFSADGENYAILIDAGDFTGNEIVPYLKEQGIEKLQVAIGTHPDADHIGQLDDVINSFEVEEVWMSGNMSSSDTFLSVLAAIDENNVTYVEPRMGDSYTIGPMEILVLYPKEVTGQSNDESIALKITYGDISFIFTGDASKSSELDILRNGLDIQGEILHLGHHGSSTSTDEQFLQAVNPKAAIYSAGDNNSYGHPSEEVVQLINKHQIPLYGTDVHGTIIVTTDGKKFSIVTEKKGTVSAKNNNERTEAEQEQPPVTNNNQGCININTASKEEIEKIIHIGPERAEDLIKLRPFRSVEDLDRIKGIGPARIKDILEEGLACIGG